MSEQFLKWGFLVFQREGLGDWSIEYGEAYCWLERKVITFDGQDRVLFLHEVAHALNPEPEGPMKNHYHGGNWAAKFAELIRRYIEVPGLTDLLEKWEMEAAENSVKESIQREQSLLGETVLCSSSNTPKLYGAEHYISDLRSVMGRAQ